MAEYDLVALWEAHCRYEFETRDVDAVMATMVEAPYVNHVPTMTGGVGHDQLKRFYKYHFIGNNPPDTSLTPISRTVGADSIVDEMLFRFTHTSAVDWMLPGVAPTGRRVEIALVAIVQFRDGKLVHEHIYWDQASVLVQVGLLDPAGLPIAGAETAHKVLDKTFAKQRADGRGLGPERGVSRSDAASMPGASRPSGCRKPAAEAIVAPGRMSPRLIDCLAHRERP